MGFRSARREPQPSDPPLWPPKGKSSFEKLSPCWGPSLTPFRGALGLGSGSSVLFLAGAPPPPRNGKGSCCCLGFNECPIKEKAPILFSFSEDKRPEIEKYQELGSRWRRLRISEVVATIIIINNNNFLKNSQIALLFPRISFFMDLPESSLSSHGIVTTLLKRCKPVHLLASTDTR